MRKPLIAGNWKMNLTMEEGLNLINSLNINEKIDVMISPSFVNLYRINEFIQKNNIRIKVAAQNMYFEKKGAFTGEISADMLLNIGVKTVIIGHSERRNIFGETDEIIEKKVCAAIDNNMTVILCVGEHLNEREAGKHEEIVISQVDAALKNINENDMKNIIIAYEPVWAIGTGKTASSEDAEAMHLVIRNFLEKKFNYDIAQNTRILYGGSVKPENIKELMSMNNIDGALVGGASLKSDSFNRLINYNIS
jgi:triosephosphate isomerase